MNTYAHRWRLAVALKQAYPRPETGAEDVTTTPAAPPPVFVPVEPDPTKENTTRALYAGIGLVVGIGATYLFTRRRR